MTYLHIIILIAALQVVDIATTVYILRTGIGYEANPIMRKLIEVFGSAPVAMIVTKVPFVALTAWAASQGAVSTEVLWVCAAISAAVAQRQQSAAIRVYLADVAASSFIDLADPGTRAGVQALEAGGLLAAGRATVILNAPVTPSERLSTT